MSSLKLVGTQALVGVGEAHHAARAAHPRHPITGCGKAGLDRISGGNGQILAVVHDQSCARHRSGGGG
jgi:hypothetical protein